MKKLTSVILAAAITVSSVTYAAAANVNIISEENLMPILSEMEIMQGDADGNLRLNDYVSRAEFSKIAVASSPYKNMVSSSIAVSPFKDVPYTFWGAPYIQIAASGGMFKGYPDGTFRPEDTVTFEEAVTVFLNLLGYTDEDFGISWPYGQVGIADKIGLCDNLNLSIGSLITRRDAAILCYNLLNTKPKGSNNYYISATDYAIVEDVTLIASHNEDSGISYGKVYTSNGMYDVSDSFNYSNVGMKGDMVTKNGDEIIGFVPSVQNVSSYNVTDVIGEDLILNDAVLDISETLTTYYKSQKLDYKTAVKQAEKGDIFKTYTNDRGSVDYALLIPAHSAVNETNSGFLDKYVIYSQLEDAIIGFKDGEFTQIDIKNSTTAYKDKVQTTYAAIKGDMEMGDVLYVKKDGGVIDYVSYEKGNIDGPYTASNENYLSYFAVNSDTDFVRNGSQANSADIQNGDILYYSKDLNMILAYNKRIIGIYEKAEPNKDTPSSVVISGKTYKIEGVNAFNKLSSKGVLSYGDTITVQLGKNNQIADVITVSEATDDIYGYVVETGIKEFTASDTTTSVKNYAKVIGTDGNEYEYSTKEKYDDLVNSLVKVTFKDGIAVLSYTKQPNISGTFDWNNKSLGKYTLSDDIEILDVYITGEGNAGAYSKIYPQRIDKSKLSTKNILFADINGNNEIKKLVLNDYTGDCYTYGLVKQAQSSSTQFSVTGSYTFIINGKEVPASTVQKAYTVGNGQPAKFTLFRNGTVDTVQALKRINGAVTELTDSTVTIGSVKYKLSDKVIIYEKDYNFDYTIKNISDIKNKLSDYQITVYQDKSEENGGRVRVLIITK